MDELLLIVVDSVLPDDKQGHHQNRGVNITDV